MTNPHIDLIYQEFLLRYRLGYDPDPCEYLERYPEHREELQKQFELFQAMESHPSWFDSSVSENFAAGEQNEVHATQSSMIPQHEEPSNVLVPNFTPKGIPGYQVLRTLGRGSSGVVFEAIQQSTGRHVALKVLTAGYGTSPNRLQRFRLESRITASLDIHGVVPVYEVGNFEETHFHSMRLIKGPDLRTAVRILRQEDSSKVEPGHVTLVHRQFGELPSQERFLAMARILSEVARVVDQAHRMGIVHRDIKPANVLLDPDGHAWLTDFGLAHLDGEVTITRTEELIGTPIYMSPERFTSQSRFVGPACDIYSLGVTLYEMLTLVPPYSAHQMPELIQQVVSAESATCRSLDPRISVDLDTIVGKAMAKLPADRYGSAGELADDLDRFLRGEPIRARRLSRLEKLGRRMRKYAALATGLGLAAIFLIGLALAIVSIYTSNLARLLRELQVTQQHTNDLLYASDMNVAFQAFQAAQPQEVERILNKHVPASSEEDRRGVEWQFLNKHIRAPQSITLPGNHGPIYELAAVPNSDLLIAVGADRIPRIWDYQRRKLIRTCDPGDDKLHAVAVSPDGNYFVSGNNEIGVWEVKTGKRVRVLRKNLPTVLESIQFNREGNLVAYGIRYRFVEVLQFKTGESYGFSNDGARHISLQFLPDGQRLRFSAETGESRRIRTMDLRLTQTEQEFWNADHGPLTRFVSDIDDDWLFAADEVTSRIVKFQIQTGQLAQQAEGRYGGTTAMSLSLSNQLLCVGRTNGLLEFYSATGAQDLANPQRSVDLRQRRILVAHTKPVTSVIALADGRFASCAEDGLIKITLPPSVSPFAQFDHLLSKHLLVRIDPATGLRRAVDQHRHVWFERAPGQWDRSHTAYPHAIEDFAATPDGHLWILDANRRCVKVSLTDISHDQVAIPLRREAHRIAISQDGRMAALTHHIYCVVYDLESGWVRRVFKAPEGVKFASISPDARRICFGGSKMYLREIGDGSESSSVRAPVSVHTLLTSSVTSRDAHASKLPLDKFEIEIPSNLTSLLWNGSEELITGHQGGEISVWDAETGRRKLAMRGHGASVFGLCLSRDGRTLFSLGADLKLFMWQLQTGQPLGELYSFESKEVADPAEAILYEDSCLTLTSDGNGLFAYLPSLSGRLHCELHW